MNNSISIITEHGVINKTVQIAVHFWNAECSPGIIQMSSKQDKFAVQPSMSCIYHYVFRGLCSQCFSLIHFVNIHIGEEGK